MFEDIKRVVIEHYEAAIDWVAEHGLGLAISLLLCVLSYFVAKRLLVRFLSYAAKRSKTSWDDVLVEEGVFRHLPYLAPAAVVYLAASSYPAIEVPIQRITLAYIAVNVIVLLDRMLNTGLVLYRRTPLAKQRPIKGYVQVAKIFVFIIGGIVAISLLINQSPWTFLGGLTAMTAVLLLIFRDTILSFVASIQINTNDMVRVGDWIQMDKYEANGDVIDMALNTVKVQNWDKTITTIPTYKLVEDSFKNWRGMQETGARRIARSLMLDQGTVRYLEPDEIQELKKIDLLRDYLEAKEKEIAEYHAERDIDITKEPLNGRRLTNIGTFRAYVANYLKDHPRIRQDMIQIVRQLEPTPKGLPLQIYGFADTTAWVEYEGIQSDIFDHLIAATPKFDLRVFQEPSGRDLARLGGEMPWSDPLHKSAPNDVDVGKM